MTANYHTHTFRCHHAAGRDKAYVKAAIKRGIKVLGFADHGPLPYSSPIRMTVRESEGYFKSLCKLKKKYKDKIDIKIGFEYEYFPEYFEWMKEFVKENGVDFIILGQHFISSEKENFRVEKCSRAEHIEKYTALVTEAIKTKQFLYVAHPDLFFYGYQKFDEAAKKAAYDICKTAKEYDVALEYNLYGLRKSDTAGKVLYPVDEFWKIARECENRVIIGIDAHFPAHITADEYFVKAENNLKSLGIVPEEVLDI